MYRLFLFIINTYIIFFRCDVTIIQTKTSTREEVLQALPGHDAVCIANHHNVNSEFLNIAGKYRINYLHNLIDKYFQESRLLSDARKLASGENMYSIRSALSSSVTNLWPAPISQVTDSANHENPCEPKADLSHSNQSDCIPSARQLINSQQYYIETETAIVNYEINSFLWLWF